MNTGENVIFSLPIIDAALGLHNIRSVICLGNTWTARRYPMTLHRHWPEVEKMLVTVDSFATPRSEWHTDPDFRRRTLQGEGFYRGVAGQMRRADLFGRIEILLGGAQYSRQRPQCGLQLLQGRRPQRQPDRVRRVPGGNRESRRRRQRDVAPRGRRNEGLRAPMRRQRQPEMIGFGVGLDLEPGEGFCRAGAGG